MGRYPGQSSRRTPLRVGGGAPPFPTCLSSTVNNDGGVDVGVNAGGGQVGSSAGGTSRQRGVIHAGEVGGVQARGMQSSAAADESRGDVGGRRSGLSPMSASQVTAGGIAPSYGYFKFTPDRISVTPPLVGRPDILTWKEAIEPQLEMAGLIGFARGTVATPGEHHPDLRAEFRAVQLLTFTVTDDLFIAQLEGQLTHLRMGDEETATDYCNRAGEFSPPSGWPARSTPRRRTSPMSCRVSLAATTC
ncbi:unnamed protein product [Closterium sp. NIES-64]|nr:unnamed protein product [Closterium sp. NIES-64]